MKPSRIVKSAILTLAACALLLTGSAWAGEVNISLAASLKDAMKEITDTYAKTHPDVTFKANSGASGAIAKQIESGAPADIFLSANKKWMDYLKEKALVDAGSISVIAYNNLVFVGSPNPAVKELKDIANLEKIAIGSPSSVPAGEYAMAAMSTAGLDKQLEKKLVLTKDVRECLMYAERGEVDGAFVYGSDTKVMTDKVKVLFTVPDHFAPEVTYPTALTVSGAGNKDAKEFFEFLKTKDVKGILAKHGFIVK